MRAQSVLVVEDEAFVAIELASVLQRSGYRVLGPASTVPQALALLEDEQPDAALLDLNLGSERVTAVAIELAFRPQCHRLVSDDGEVRRLLQAVLSSHSS